MQQNLSVAGTDALAAVKNVEQLYAVRSEYAESDYQSAVDYSRSVYELSTQPRRLAPTKAR